MSQELFIEELAQLLEVESNQLTADFQLQQCNNWDSLTIVSVIGLFSAYFKLNIGIADLEQCVTLGDLLSLAHA